MFSHPWVYPLVSDVLRWQDQLIVYDAQNVESVLRYRLLGDSEVGLRIVRHATAVERELCRRADLVLACSHEDRELFHRLYEMPFAKCLVTPNGTFVGEAPSESARRDKKRRLGLADTPLAIFIGSLFPPNEEAARFICSELAPALPEVTFAICGGVGAAIDADSLARRGIGNVRITGTLDDAARREYLGAADVAVNPMFSGSGTNIKMFDFMAAGLPVISTPTGARGINLSGSAVHISAPGEFAGAVRTVLADQEYRKAPRHDRTTTRVRELFVGAAVPAPGTAADAAPERARTRGLCSASSFPRTSVTRTCRQLLDCLAAQTFRDFEVILVDQSAARWNVPDAYSSLDILYEHTDLKGTSRARNLGAWLARGDVIAFTDDDCQPEPGLAAERDALFRRAAGGWRGGTRRLRTRQRPGVPGGDQPRVRGHRVHDREPAAPAGTSSTPSTDSTSSSTCRSVKTPTWDGEPARSARSRSATTSGCSTRRIRAPSNVKRSASGSGSSRRMRCSSRSIRNATGRCS